MLSILQEARTQTQLCPRVGIDVPITVKPTSQRGLLPRSVCKWYHHSLRKPAWMTKHILPSTHVAARRAIVPRPSQDYGSVSNEGGVACGNDTNTGLSMYAGVQANAHSGDSKCQHTDATALTVAGHHDRSSTGVLPASEPLLRNQNQKAEACAETRSPFPGPTTTGEMRPQRVISDLATLACEDCDRRSGSQQQQLERPSTMARSRLFVGVADPVARTALESMQHQIERMASELAAQRAHCTALTARLAQAEAQLHANALTAPNTAAPGVTIFT
jgi:hypothetical protein